MSHLPSDQDLDARIRVDKIPGAGRVVKIDADEKQREALAERFGVTEVQSFAANVTATRFRGGVRAIGQVDGTIVQPCVVTGDPVTQNISEPVDRIFLPGHEAASEATAGAEIFVNLEEDDLPDYYDGDEIDLGETVMEIFALAIDLYPRAPGAELEGGVAGDDPAKLSPFAALKTLKGE